MELNRKVAIVFCNISYKELIRLLESMHVWILNTHENNTIVNMVWKMKDYQSLDTTVTLFDAYASGELLSNVLNDIEEHHGDNRNFPSWSSLYIYGLDLTIPIKVSLSFLVLIDMK